MLQMLISSFFIEDTIYPDRGIYFWFVAGHVALLFVSQTVNLVAVDYSLIPQPFLSSHNSYGLLAVEYPAMSSTWSAACLVSCSHYSQMELCRIILLHNQMQSPPTRCAFGMNLADYHEPEENYLSNYIKHLLMG